jgi:tRNA(fMet)-specific endonuclease VapC
MAGRNADRRVSPRTRLEAAGQLIGPHDLLIASHALALGCTLVTDNEREFSRVEGMSMANWLR